MTELTVPDQTLDERVKQSATGGMELSRNIAFVL
jgi:hypothetical protein